MDSDSLRTLLRYNYASHRHLWDSIMQLTDEQYVEEVPYSVGSVRNHMTHLISTDERWIARLLGTELPSRLRPEDCPTRETTLRRWEGMEAFVMPYVDDLDEVEARRQVNYDIPHRGGKKINYVWQVLVHLVNHGTDHRSQILRLLNEFGVPTFEQDFIIYLWDHPLHA